MLQVRTRRSGCEKGPESSSHVVVVQRTRLESNSDEKVVNRLQQLLSLTPSKSSSEMYEGADHDDGDEDEDEE